MSANYASSNGSSASRTPFCMTQQLQTQSISTTSPENSLGGSISAYGILPLYTHVGCLPCPVLVFQHRVFQRSRDEYSQAEITNTRDAELRKSHTDVETSVMRRAFPGTVCVCLRQFDSDMLMSRRMVQDCRRALRITGWMHVNGTTTPIVFRYVRFIQRTFNSVDLVFEENGDVHYLAAHDGEIAHIDGISGGSRRLTRGQTVLVFDSVEVESVYTPVEERLVRMLVERGRGFGYSGLPRAPFNDNYKQHVGSEGVKYALLVNVWCLYMVVESAQDKAEFEIFYSDYCRFVESPEFAAVVMEHDAREAYIYAKEQLRELRSRHRRDVFDRRCTVVETMWRRRSREVADFKTYWEERDARERTQTSGVDGAFAQGEARAV